MSHPPLAQIGKAYGLTRQRMHRMIRKEGVSVETVLDPEALFRAKLEGNRSRFRERLANPEVRSQIANTLQTLTRSI